MGVDGLVRDIEYAIERNQWQMLARADFLPAPRQTHEYLDGLIKSVKSDAGGVQLEYCFSNTHPIVWHTFHNVYDWMLGRERSIDGFGPDPHSWALLVFPRWNDTVEYTLQKQLHTPGWSALEVLSRSDPIWLRDPIHHIRDVMLFSRRPFPEDNNYDGRYDFLFEPEEGVRQNWEGHVRLYQQTAAYEARRILRRRGKTFDELLETTTDARQVLKEAEDAALVKYRPTEPSYDQRRLLQQREERALTPVGESMQGFDMEPFVSKVIRRRHPARKAGK